MKLLMGTIAALAILMVGTPSEARDRKGAHKHMKKVLKQLNLSDGQKEKLKELKKGGKQERKAFRKKTKEAKKAFHQALKSNSDEGEIKSRFETFHQLRSDKMRKRFDHMMQIWSVLNPEQR